MSRHLADPGVRIRTWVHHSRAPNTPNCCATKSLSCSNGNSLLDSGQGLLAGSPPAPQGEEVPTKRRDRCSVPRAGVCVAGALTACPLSSPQRGQAPPTGTASPRPVSRTASVVGQGAERESARSDQRGLASGQDPARPPKDWHPPCAGASGPVPAAETEADGQRWPEGRERWDKRARNPDAAIQRAVCAFLCALPYSSPREGPARWPQDDRRCITVKHGVPMWDWKASRRRDRAFLKNMTRQTLLRYKKEWIFQHMV